MSDNEKERECDWKGIWIEKMKKVNEWIKRIKENERKMKKVIRKKERLWGLRKEMDFGRGMNEELRMGLRVKVINGVWIVKGLWREKKD